MAWSATRTPGDVRGRVGAAALVHQAINRAAAAAILTREPAAREFQSEGHSAAVLLCCGCGQRCTTAMQIHGSPPNRLRSCESGGGRDTLETVGPAAYSTETASTMGRGHRVCECNMLHVHAVRLVSHTRCRAAARGARPPSSLRGPCGGVAARGTIRIPNRSVRYAYGTEHIPNKGQKARRLRHAATRDFLAELAASRGAGRSCLDSGTSRPSTLPRR